MVHRLFRVPRIEENDRPLAQSKGFPSGPALSMRAGVLMQQGPFREQNITWRDDVRRDRVINHSQLRVSRA